MLKNAANLDKWISDEDRSTSHAPFSSKMRHLLQDYEIGTLASTGPSLDSMSACLRR
jgi:hypothetical protein